MEAIICKDGTILTPPETTILFASDHIRLTRRYDGAILLELAEPHTITAFDATVVCLEPR